MSWKLCISGGILWYNPVPNINIQTNVKLALSKWVVVFLAIRTNPPSWALTAKKEAVFWKFFIGSRIKDAGALDQNQKLNSNQLLKQCFWMGMRQYHHIRLCYVQTTSNKVKAEIYFFICEGTANSNAPLHFEKRECLFRKVQVPWWRFWRRKRTMERQF